MKKYIFGFLFALLISVLLFNFSWAKSNVVNIVSSFSGLSGTISPSQLDLTGAYDWTGLHTFSQNLNASGTLTVQGNSSLRGTLAVTGASTASSTLNVQGAFQARASSTFPTYATCTLKTTAAGLLECGTDNTGGGGGASSTFTYIFAPGGAVVSSTGGAALNKRVTANWVDLVLDYDPTTQENAYFSVTLPDEVPTTGVASATLTWIWSSTDASSSQTFVAGLDYRCMADDEVWDAATTPAEVNTTSSDTWIADGDIHTVVMPMASTTMFSANDFCQFRLYRDVAADTIGRDVSVFRSLFRLRW